MTVSGSPQGGDVTGKRFRLARPEQRPRERGDPPLGARAVRAWADALPTGNLGETAKRLYQALAGLNRIRERPRDRLRFLTGTEAAVADVSAALQGRLAGQGLPLPRQAAQVADFIRALHTECARGFWIAGEDLVAHPPWLGRKDTALALQRTLHHLGTILLHRYRLYTPPPEGLWQALHRAYRLAEEHGLAGQAVACAPGAAAGETTTAADTYKGALLLALSGPFGCPRGWIDDIHQVAAASAPRTRLGPCTGRSDATARFVVLLDGDDGPFHPGLRAPDPGAGTCRDLDLEGLSLDLRQADGGLAEVLDHRAPADLVEHLALAWGVPRARSAHRAPGEGRTIETVIGLAALHDVLSHSAMGTPAGQPARRSEFSTRMTRSEEAARDIWTLFHPREDGRLTAGTATSATDPEQGPAVHHWPVADHGGGGYCLMPQNDAPSSFGVGSVLGLARHDGSGWEVGAVRWLQRKEDGSARVGVEVLAGTAEAIAVRPADGTDPQRGILFRADEGIPDTLLVPSLLFRRGQLVTLLAVDEERKVLLGARLEETGQAARFRFHEPERETARAQQREGFGDHFWSNL